MFPPGTRLGPYEIVAPIGSGGMGDVYRARDSRLSREVAIKVLPERLLKDADARARFDREAKAVAALTHPNILAIHDFGSADGASYSVTELLEGQTLRQRLLQGALSWRKTIEIGAAIADGLAAAHAKGIIHRDLKPENIFLTSDGRVKILDFGIASLVQPHSEDGSLDPSSMPTAPLRTDSDSVVMGTAGYMSPEQLRAQPAEPTSDIFSLGCLLYEMVTGRAAFIRSTTIDSLSAILTETPDPFTATRGMIPFELAKLIDRCLEKNRAARFQSASDLAYALRAIGASTSLSFELPQTSRRRRVIVIAACVLAVLFAAGFFLWKRNRTTTPRVVATAPAAIRTLAILPFTNATGDTEAEYMSDGITETLINTLSQVPSLKVMSRTSVFQYKGKDTPPVRIAKELGVGAVVVGRVNSVGNRLVVSVELVDATDRSQLWGNRYTATRADIFTIQQSMAAEISRRLRLELTGREERLLSKRHTEDPAAYELYLKGRFQWNKRSAESLYKAIEYFNQAIEIDPQYALAYAGIADCYNLLDIWAGLPTKETFPKAKAAAEKALAIDDQLAEAHTSLAYAMHNYEWKWSDAEREYRRALELNPNYATAHQWYSELLTAMGRFDDAEREARKALDIDPMSPIINAVAGWNFMMARHYDKASEQTLRTTQLFPAFMPGHAYLGLTKLEQGKAAEAIPPLLKAQELLDIVVVRTWLARAQLAAGKRAEAQRLLDDLEARAPREYLPPYYMAALYAAFGDRERAFRDLDQALEERTGAMVWLNVDPAFDPLRNDPRFAALRKRAAL